MIHLYEITTDDWRKLVYVNTKHEQKNWFSVVSISGFEICKSP